MGRKPKYYGCKFQGCRNKHYTRGFCRKHATAFYKGKLDEDGNPLDGYKEKPLATYCRFPDCQKRGTAKQSLRRGLCNKHRKWAEKGIIDWETLEILKPDKVPKKRSIEVHVIDGQQHVFRRKCVVEGCLKESRRAGFCTQHSSSYYQGKRKKDGTPTYERKYYDYKKDKCKIDGCPAKLGRLVKGFCLYHYNNHFRTGYIDINGNPTSKKKIDRRFKEHRKEEQDGLGN